MLFLLFFLQEIHFCRLLQEFAKVMLSYICPSQMMTSPPVMQNAQMKTHVPCSRMETLILTSMIAYYAKEHLSAQIILGIMPSITTSVIKNEEVKYIFPNRQMEKIKSTYLYLL